MRLLLFDIDGTLVLTGGAGSRAMTRAFAETHGLEDALQKVDLAGRTDRIIMRDALTHAGRPTTTTSTLDAFREAYCAALREEIQQPGNGRRGLLPGVRPLLEALAGRDDVRLALLTGNFRASAEIKLAAFDVWELLHVGRVRRRRHRARRPDRGRARAARDRARARRSSPTRWWSSATRRTTSAAPAPAAPRPSRWRPATTTSRRSRGHQPDALFADLTDTDAVLEALLR